jgi:dual specificity protein kinase YAK1
LDLLGQGTFGQVVKCMNLSTGAEVAVKVVKNKPAYSKQGLIERQILKEVKIQNLLNSQLSKFLIFKKLIFFGEMCSNWNCFYLFFIDWVVVKSKT